MTRRVKQIAEGNKHFRLISIRKLVSDPQFRSGYRDRLKGLPPRRFYYDDARRGARANWGYERGRAVVNWLLATGRPPPAIDDVYGLIEAYMAAEAADAVL